MTFKLFLKPKLKFTPIVLFGFLGFYRGYTTFNYKKFKGIHKTKINYLECIMYGIMISSCYINPALIPFALADEYEKATLLINDNVDENTYYKNYFFDIIE